MRSRTELMFQVVRENRMRTASYHGSRACPHVCPQRAGIYYLRMISAQTRAAFVARENRCALFRIMRYPGGSA
jgi:hypothetical protein